MRVLYESRGEDIGRFGPEKLTTEGGTIAIAIAESERPKRIHLFAGPVIGYEFEDDYEVRLFDEAVARLLEQRVENEERGQRLPPEAVAEAIRAAVDDLPVGTVIPFDKK